MNKSLVERIKRITASAYDDDPCVAEILDDVRELVEAAKPFDSGDHIEGLSGDYPCRIEVTAWDIARLSAILRKVGGE